MVREQAVVTARAIGYAAAICAAGLILGTAAVFAWGLTLRPAEAADAAKGALDAVFR